MSETEGNDEPSGYAYFGGPRDGQPVKHVSDDLLPAAIGIESEPDGHYRLDQERRRYVWTPEPLPYA